MRKKFFAMSSLLLGGAMVITAANANAFIIDWNDTVNYSIVSATDPVDNGNGRDITKAWSATNGTNYYFRLDLVDSPFGVSANAGIYGIYIDAVAGGVSSGHTYVPATPDTFTTDRALDSHYASDMGGFHKSDFHVWNGTDMALMGTPSNAHNENGGKTLEWQIAVSELGTGFSWFAASHDYIEDVVQLTWDRTVTMSAAPSPAPVPVPAAALLLGSGLVGLASCRRRV